MSKLYTLTRDQILAADDLPTEAVEVPEWGGVVIVRGLTGTERDRFESEIVSVADGKRSINTGNIRARLVALSVVDPEGKRMFSRDDVAALGKKSGRALDRVFECAQRLSGISDTEDLEKNSPGDPSVDSTSD